MRFKLPTRSPPKRRHEYEEDPATVCSTINSKLKNISPRLASSLVVSAIIHAIRRRQVVYRLYLGASSIGDTGCIRIFGFLNSTPSGLYRRECLTELHLTSNEIGARGLLAVAAFLRNNTVLREVCLSGNPLTTNPDVISEFTRALNSSHTCTLQMLHCNSLGDSFALVFLPLLTTPYLRELDLSAINMTRASVPVLVDYVKSTRCRLRRLHCNANSLTLSGAHLIVSAIKVNSSLQSVKLDDLHMDSDATAVAMEDRIIEWQGCNQSLSTLLQRNLIYMRRVRHESLALLQYSRALFLRSRAHEAKHGTRTLVSAFRSPLSQFERLSPFFNLPAEVQQEIISYLAPSLSHKQRMRIVHFAADITTLLPPHPQFIEEVGTKQLMKPNFGKRPPQQKRPCEGSWRPPVRWRREMKDIWLARVACDVYEHLF